MADRAPLRNEVRLLEVVAGDSTHTVRWPVGLSAEGATVHPGYSSARVVRPALGGVSGILREIPRRAVVRLPFDPRAEVWVLPAGYGEAGLMVTTQFFAIKIARYMQEHGISERTLAAVAAKAFRNGAINPNAWRREALTEEAVAAEMRRMVGNKMVFGHDAHRELRRGRMAAPPYSEL